MKAFIGRSFDEKDKGLVNTIVEFIESHDIDCGDAKSAKSRKVEDKIRGLISECDIFIGVFTRNEPICKKKKKTKWYCKPRNENTIYTTSNWVIQESGFALGTDRHLILLKENGVCELPKLQGNLEYIPFNRSNLQEPFLKISQMISDMKTQASGGAIEKSSGELTIPDETKPEEQEGQPKEKIKDEKKEVLGKVYSALWRDEDYIEAQRILDDEAQALLDEDDKAATCAIILRCSRPLGNVNTFEKLQELVQENKDNPRVIKQLGHSYKEIGEFKKAKEQFIIAAEKYDVNDAEKKSGLVNAHVQAAWCLADDDDLNDALILLKKLLSNPDFQDSKAQIFKGMAEISKKKDDIERFFIYAEAALDVDPCDADIRATLAYAYSENKCEKLSLLHYKKVTDTTINRIALNNLGSQYGVLKLSYKCVQSYYKSVDQKETLAMANLAQKYLNEGFIKDARELVDRANKLSNEGVKVDYRVGRAQERINNLTEEESKKEKVILAEAEKERNFRVDYSKAFCSDRTVAKSDIEGVWETPWGNLKLAFDDTAGSFRMSGTKQMEIGQFAALLTPSQPKLEKQFKNQTIEITGTIEYMSGKYSITVKDEENTTLLTGGNIHEATAYMVISESCNCIEIMEKTSNNKTEYKQWKKHEEKIKEE